MDPNLDTPQVMANAVPIGQDTQPDTGVSIGAPTPPVNLPDPVATDRAIKIHQAVGTTLQKDADEIKAEIQAGREKGLREQAASTLEMQRQHDRLLTLQKIANSSSTPLNQDEVQSILDPFNPANKPLSPDSVVEKYYGLQYINTLKRAADVTNAVNIAQAQGQIPEHTEDTFLKGSDLTATMEGFRKIREDVESTISQQSYAGYGADFIKNMFQPYVEAKVRANIGLYPGTFLGSAMQDKADEIFALPSLEDRISKAKEIVNSLKQDNPQLALRFAQYLEGLPTSDRILDNAFSVMAPLDYAAFGKGAINIAQKVSLARRTNTAVRQLVAAADKVGTDTAARAEAAGDISTASTEKSTGVVLQNLNGATNPIDMVTEPLLTNMRQGKERIGADLGNLSGEQGRRIQDQYEASGTGFIQRIVDAARINRIPMALATRNAVQVLKDAVLDFYPGVRNAILDVSDPLYEPRSNTYWHEVTVGNYDGTLFSNQDTAKNFADRNGLSSAKVVEGNGPITNARTQQLLDQKVQVEKNLADIEAGLNRHKLILSDERATQAQIDAAQEQVQGLGGWKKQNEEKLNEINLRLKGDETYSRVSSLQAEVNRLKADSKAVLAAAKGSEDPAIRQAARDRVNANKQTIRGHNQEIEALGSGRAESITRQDTVQQHGVGYKIVARRPLVETDDAVRDLMIRDHNGNLIKDATSTSSQTGFKSLFNAALWRFRGADDTLAINESIQRKIGTYTQSLFKEWAAQEAGYIRQITSGVIRNDPVTGAPIPYWRAKPSAVLAKLTGQHTKEYSEFLRTLEFARDKRDPAGNMGYFFQTPGELQNHYQTYFKRDPTFAEHQAYFAFTRMVEGDRILREIAEFRNRARLGVEQFQLKTRGPKGGFINSDFFDGRALKKFPGGDDVLMIMGRKQGDERLVNLGGAGASPQRIEEMRRNVEQGKAKVIEVYAPEHTPLRTFSDVAGSEHVRYIYTENALESKPIEFNHVNRRGGGHFEYDYDYFLKQAKMYHQYETTPTIRGKYRSVYYGDRTFMPLLNRAMGEDIAVHLHEVQRLIKNGEEAAAERYTQTHLPIEWNKLRDMFRPTRDELGRQVPPLLDLNEPFHVVPKGRTVLSVDRGLEAKYGTSFKDAARSGSLNRQFAVEYNTERESEGLQHVMDIGTAGNPIYKYSPTSKMIDPITTMNKSLNRIVNTAFLDDYKIYAVEHWLREAEEHLEPVRARLARSSPYWVFTSSIDKSAFRESTPWETVQNLLSNRYKIKQFIGIPSTFDTAVNSAKQMLIDWSYRKFGPEDNRSIGGTALTIAPLWMLDHIKDPVTRLRSLTFHEKLGLFNPAQFLVQAQSHATIWALSPKHASSSLYGTLLYTWSRAVRDPEFLRTLDNYASKMSLPGQSKWRPGEFQEAVESAEKTGFLNVAGEHSNLNTALKTDFVGNDLKSILNAGTFFFKEGEKSTRASAWFTAYREFREANPTGAIGRDDLGKILQRADLLTANMSRASNSALQSGVFSLTSQFLTYQMRLAEMMLGSRISKMDKFRMLAMYSALYGAPSAVGLYGLPMSDAIRKEAIQRGYTLGDNWLSTAMDQGLPAMWMAYMTSGSINPLNWQKGNNYNIGDRFGSPGFTQFNEALKSDHPWWQLLAGASGTSLLNTISSTSNFFHVMGSMLHPQNKDHAFPITLDDFVDVFKEISSVNQTWKLIMAIETGKWMSKNEGYVGDVSKANAAFMAMTGLSPQQQDDLYIKGGILKEQEALQKYVMGQAVKEIRRGYENQKQGGYNEAKKNFTRADTLMTISGFPVERKADVYQQATKGYETMIQEKDWELANKNVPQSRSDFMGIPMPFNTQTGIPGTRLDQYRKQLQLNSLKGQ